MSEVTPGRPRFDARSEASAGPIDTSAPARMLEGCCRSTESPDALMCSLCCGPLAGTTLLPICWHPPDTRYQKAPVPPATPPSPMHRHSRHLRDARREGAGNNMLRLPVPGLSHASTLSACKAVRGSSPRGRCLRGLHCHWPLPEIGTWCHQEQARGSQGVPSPAQEAPSTPQPPRARSPGRARHPHPRCEPAQCRWSQSSCLFCTITVGLKVNAQQGPFPCCIF